MENLEEKKNHARPINYPFLHPFVSFIVKDRRLKKIYYFHHIN